MSGPLQTVAFWDSRRSSEQLFVAIASVLTEMGAVIRIEHPGCARVSDHNVFTPDGEPADLEIAASHGGRGGLVELTWSLATLDHQPPERWHDHKVALTSLVATVKPSLANISVEAPRPSLLPDPTWEEAQWWFLAGWVDLDACSDRQRAAFTAMRDVGLAADLGDGIWWTVWGDISIKLELGTFDRHAVAAAAFEAWTGETAPDPEPEFESSLTAEDLAPREIWFWSCDRPAETLLRSVERAVEPRGLSTHVWDFGQPRPWRFVLARFEPKGRLVEDLLDDLRAVVSEIEPSWAGVQPQSGVLMPGPVTDVPAVSMITHPWVSRAWAGSDLSRLDQALAGCHREELGEGILWITDPDLVPNGRLTETWYDADERFERLSEAADILGQVARRSVGMAP